MCIRDRHQDIRKFIHSGYQLFASGRHLLSLRRLRRHRLPFLGDFFFPQPFVTVAQTKIENLRVALDLTEEWDALDNGSALLTGVVVARKEVAEANPGAVDLFLEDYAASVDWVNANPADAAALIAQYGIVEAAPVAEKALPHCNIVCVTGSEMRDKLSGYLQVLFDANPDAVGGKLPEADFYYGA